MFWFLLVFFVIRSLLAQPFYIPSSSMEPGLREGDFIMTTKYSYGYSKYSSAPLIINALPDKRLFNHAPKRGDVAVFKTPSDDCRIHIKGRIYRKCRDFIKRIVGLPGDTVQMRGGVLYLNGQAVRQDMLEASPDGTTEPPSVRFYRETLPNGASYIIRDSQPNTEADDTEVFTVPEDHYFMMGDNRDNSADSRFLPPRGISFVPEVNLVGKARFIMFSVDEKFSILKPWTWYHFRPGHFFKKIEWVKKNTLSQTWKLK